MLVVSAAQMRELDRETIENVGIPGLLLMENAGRGVAEYVKAHYGKAIQKGVLVIAGPGNNGGDGFVIARHLFQSGIEVKILLLVGPERYRGDARSNYEIAKRLEIPMMECLDETAVTSKEKSIKTAGLIVDAIFGTGLSRPPAGRFAAVISIINKGVAPVVAVDIPSGLSADTGQPLSMAVKADSTVTMALPKTGHVLSPGREYTGTLEVIDIGIPASVIVHGGINTEVLDDDSFSSMLRPRPDSGHKGTFGHLLVLAGSRGKTGAAALVARGGLRAGAGLVTVGCPKSAQPILATKLTESMTIGLPETSDGSPSMAVLDRLDGLLKGKKAVAIGPGIGLGHETMELVRRLVSSIPLPLVADADALTAIGTDHALVKNAPGYRILTPHPGEMARLTGLDIAAIQQDRVSTTRSLARATGAIVVLKGAGTVIARPDGRVAINSTGNPGMGAGGMGDVLTGIIGALLAQGYDAWDATRIAVFAHGKAADMLARVRGKWGYLAREVADFLPSLWP